MRAHHKINVVGGKTNAGEALEIRRLQAVKKLVCWKALVVPNAAIDQDRMSARAQHPAMIAVDHVTGMLIKVLRDQPVRLPSQRIFRKTWQEAWWEEWPAYLLDTVDAEPA
jgi:hypothetical protein